MFFYNFDNNYGDQARIITFAERVNGWRVHWYQRKKSGPAVTPNTDTVSQDVIKQNDIFASFSHIYSSLRQQANLSFFLPRCASFNSCTAVRAYVYKNAYSSVALSLNLAEQLYEFKTNPNPQIRLPQHLLTSWNNNVALRNIINTYNPQFYNLLTAPSAAPRVIPA